MNRFYGFLYGGAADSDSDSGDGEAAVDAMAVHDPVELKPESTASTPPKGSPMSKQTRHRRRRQERASRLHDLQTSSGERKQRERHVSESKPAFFSAGAIDSPSPTAKTKKKTSKTQKNKEKTQKATKKRGSSNPDEKGVAKSKGHHRHAVAKTRVKNGSLSQGVERMHDFEVWKREQKRAAAVAAVAAQRGDEDAKLRRHMVGYDRWTEIRRDAKKNGSSPNGADHGARLHVAMEDSLQRQKTEATRARLEDEISMMGKPKLTKKSLEIAGQLESDGKRPVLHGSSCMVNEDGEAIWKRQKGQKIGEIVTEREAKFAEITRAPRPSPLTEKIMRGKDAQDDDGVSTAERLFACGAKFQERKTARQEAEIQKTRELATHCGSSADLSRLVQLASPRQVGSPRDRTLSSDGKHASRTRLQELSESRSPSGSPTPEGDLLDRRLAKDFVERSPTEKQSTGASRGRLQALAVSPRTKSKLVAGKCDSPSIEASPGSRKKTGSKPPEAEVLAVRRRKPPAVDDSTLREHWPEWKAAMKVVGEMPARRRATARAELFKIRQKDLPAGVVRMQRLQQVAAAETAVAERAVSRVPADQREAVRVSLEAMAETERAGAIRQMEQLHELVATVELAAKDQAEDGLPAAEPAVEPAVEPGGDVLKEMAAMLEYDANAGTVMAQFDGSTGLEVKLDKIELEWINFDKVDTANVNYQEPSTDQERDIDADKTAFSAGLSALVETSSPKQEAFTAPTRVESAAADDLMFSVAAAAAAEAAAVNAIRRMEQLHEQQLVATVELAAKDQVEDELPAAEPAVEPAVEPGGDALKEMVTLLECDANAGTVPAQFDDSTGLEVKLDKVNTANVNYQEPYTDQERKTDADKTAFYHGRSISAGLSASVEISLPNQEASTAPTRVESAAADDLIFSVAAAAAAEAAAVNAARNTRKKRTRKKNSSSLDSARSKMEGILKTSSGNSVDSEPPE
jgi:hypothetical protein